MESGRDDGTVERGARRLVVASNRLPVKLECSPEGEWTRARGSGGLVTALEPVLREEGGVWVGWPGVLEGEVPDLEAVLAPRDGEPYRFAPVELTAEERDDFYLGFANEILWPLFHGLQDRCNYEPRYWKVYHRVNAKFAEAIAGVVEPNDYVWVHDYHLMAAGEELRLAGVENRIGFFLHIPFPSVDSFEQLPWAEEVLVSLLSFDDVGFQTDRDRRNFLACVQALGVDDADVSEMEVDESTATVRLGDRTIRVGVFPISIDFDSFHEGARAPAVADEARRLREELKTERMLIGVDRLDYTKGIPQKLAGFERALERHPELRGRVSLVQLVIPSRVSIPEYREMKEEIEGLVGRINGRFTRHGWVPILYQFGSWERTELLAHYRAADIALVTSLRDGMNLVSKEFCAASVDGRGVLILSAFAGSADELGEHSILVNPNDVEGVAEAIRRACSIPDETEAEWLRRLQATVRENDVHAWVRRFLARGSGKGEAQEAEGVVSGQEIRAPAQLRRGDRGRRTALRKKLKAPTVIASQGMDGGRFPPPT